MRVRRPLIVVATVVAAALALSGCSILAPTRDADGNVVAALPMPSVDAWVGDCFTFIDGSNLAYATVVPCADPHTHLVIGRGTLTQKRIDYFETLQIAVLTACKDRVEVYGSEKGIDPEPEYIVGTKTSVEGVKTLHYSCLVKDSAP